VISPSPPLDERIGLLREPSDAALPEVAVSVVQLKGLGCFAESPELRADRWRGFLANAALAYRLAALPPTHLYLGSEFCEHLLPSTETLRAALDLAAGAGLNFALLTPIAAPATIHQLCELLPLLPPAAEVVINDWGVGHLLRERFPALRPAAGRILCRMTRDPRLPGAAWARHCVHGLHSGRLLSALRRIGIRRLELDVPPFATAQSFAHLPLPAAVHLPLAVVAKGRMCRLGSVSLAGPERFAPGRPCRKECLQLAADMTRPRFADASETLQLGNTVLARHTGDMAAAVAAAIAEGSIQRLIVPGEPL
jgi:hypothetical protein